jgi:exodeoxyribonuclease VII large subunit
MPENINNTEAQSRDIYNVTRLNREVRAVLEGSFPISNLAQPASGHIYFSLKDEHSQIRCAMFRNKNRSLKFNPENGMLILVRANVSLYEDRGEFQLIIEHMEAAGDGALQRAFEALKQRLYEEGLFSDSHKQIIPTTPKAIGVITSPSGAAIRDILSILLRRFPLTNVIIYPTAVQGEEAEGQIIKMLEIAEIRKECDVLILARGGGSLEDLWVFNNENVARSIYKCTLPIVTGIGHEIDFTIADFVADERAATPSAAAELVSPDQIQIKQQLRTQNEKLLQLISNNIKQHQQHILQLGKRLPHPAYQLQTLIQRLDHLQQSMSHATYVTINTQKMRLNNLAATLGHYNPAQSLQLYSERYAQTRERLKQALQYKLQHFNNELSNLSRTLDAISPLASLNRGYAIVSKLENNELVRDARQLNTGDIILTRFSQGQTHSTVNKIIKKNE